MSASVKSQSFLNISDFPVGSVGDHHIFTKAGIEDIIDLQEDDGKCKPYQIRQVRKVFRKENVHV